MRKKLNLLLADDDSDDRFFFEKALSELTIQTQLKVIEDGEKLMTFLLKNFAELPDVLFLDLNMPRKNGSECLVEIRASEKLKHLPVIIYSTSLHENIADILYEKGAHYYIRKTDTIELPKILQRALGLIVDKKMVKPPRDKFVLNMVEV